MRQHGGILRQAPFRNEKGLRKQAQRWNEALPLKTPRNRLCRAASVVLLGGSRKAAQGGYFACGLDLNKSNGKVNLIGTPMRLLINDCCKMVSVLFVTQ